jgi:hypothetical protein
MRLDLVRWATLTVLALGLSASALPAAPQSGDQKGKPVSPADKIRHDMDQAVTIDVAEQPLNLAINQLREQTRINFVLDKATMGAMGIDLEQMPVTVKLKDVKLRTALRNILGPYNLSFAILGDTVLISTDEMAMHRQMRQRVNVDLDNVDFATALKRLGQETATNLVLDARVAKEAQGKVTLQLEDVPLEMAVRLMAEMVGLKPVRVGNALFVCSKASAKELREDPDLYPPQPRVGPDGNPLPPGIGLPPGVAFPPGFNPGVVPGVIGNVQVMPLKDRPAQVEVPRVVEQPPQPPKDEPRREDPRPERPDQPR